MEKIGIIGLGLMGTSLALALKKYLPGIMIAGSDQNQRHLAFNLANQTINQQLTSDNLGQMELIFLATPVHSIIPVLGQLRAKINRSKTIVTDLGSTKEEICRSVKKLYPDLMFIGGHPMTGKENSGPGAAEADLFVDKSYILTTGAEPIIEQKLTALLKKIGARIVFLDPAEHDHMVAITSHLPQLLATALINQLFEYKEYSPRSQALIGPGFLGLTRIAASNPRMWTDIYRSNRVNLLKTIDQMVTILQQYRKEIQADNEEAIYDFMNRGREGRLELRGEDSNGLADQTTS